jgi:ABC-2 type transport system permease protein
MGRYFTLLRTSLRASLGTAMAYRVDFVIGGLISMWWMVWTLVPIAVVFGARQSVAGWTFPGAMLVVAWFTALRALMEGMISPSLIALVDGIRQGTLDFVLLKPADAQFMVSTARFAPFKLFDLGAAGVILAWALGQIGRRPGLGDLGLALVLLASGIAVLYAMFIVVACAAFWVVRLDNLAYLLTSIFDAARWPLQVFRGAWRLLFTFVIPLGIMTTYPAMALLGRLSVSTALASVGGAILALTLARFAWLRSIRAYTSASS